MKISVILIDGGFRKNNYTIDCMLLQSFPQDDYEVIYVEYGDAPHERLESQDRIKLCRLKARDCYWPAKCFNRGILESRGELLVIMDADLIFEEDFLKKIWEQHQGHQKLACYVFRYDEPPENRRETTDIVDLDSRYKLYNPFNYGGCLSVKKDILLALNGFDEHEVFRSHFHAHGLDMYTRLKNVGIPIVWHPHLKTYHPWHEHTRIEHSSYQRQLDVIHWRAINRETKSLLGIDQKKNRILELDNGAIDSILENSSAKRRGLRAALRKLLNFFQPKL